MLPLTQNINPQPINVFANLKATLLILKYYCASSNQINQIRESSNFKSQIYLTWGNHYFDQIDGSCKKQISMILGN